jgi:hypothetical protein
MVRVPPPAPLRRCREVDVLLLVLRVKRDGPHKREASWPPYTNHRRQAKKSSPQKMWTSLNAEPRRPANAQHAELSAARSIKESARQHERVARVQDVTVEQGISDVDVHRRSAIRHRQAAAVDRRVAEQRRKEFEAELSPGTDG